MPQPAPDPGAETTTAIGITSGLVVESDIPLRGRRTARSYVDLRVVRLARSAIEPMMGGETIAELRLGEKVVQTISSTDGGWRIDFHGYATATISQNLLHCNIAPSSDEGEALLEVLVAGPVLAFVLTMSGHPVLHGSCVEHRHRAVAFAAASGGGKSTLAAMLCLRGANLVTDDILRTETRDGQLFALPGSPELRLRPGAAALAHDVEAPRRATADERTAVLLGSDDASPVPLVAVVLPRLDRSADAATSRRLQGSEAVAALLARPRLPHLAVPHVLAQLLATCTDIAEHVPVLEVTLPWQDALRPEVPEHLARLLAAEVGWP